MKINLIKNRILLLAMILFFTFVVKAEGSFLCSPKGYTVISLNGMLTTSNGAIENKEKIKKNLFASYDGQEVFVDYVYNPTHGFFADLIDSMTQKGSEKMFVSNTHDLKNMLIDLSKKVKTQKLLIVAHSQGNFYANDIYRTLADTEGGISKASMGIYGIGTPTSYIAGGGKYILSKNDSIINKIRLFGMLDILPANVDIPKDSEDKLNGHGLSDSYLKYQGKRISAEISTMLHLLQEDAKQDPSKVCIEEPQLDKLDEIVGTAYLVLDPIQEVISDSSALVFNEMVTPTVKAIVRLGKNYMDFLNGFFASSGGGIIDMNDELGFEESQALGDLILSEENLSENKNNITEDENDKNNFSKERSDSLILDSKDGIEKLNETKENLELSDRKISLHAGHRHSSLSGEDSSNPEDEKIEDDNEEEEEIEDVEDEDENTTTPPTNTGDIVPPVIFLVGDENLRISNGSEYLEYGATANDNVDGAVDVIRTGNVDTTTNGFYTIVYKAKDKSGNESTKERTVEVYTPLSGFLVDENTELPDGEYFFDNVTITNNATLTLLTDTTSTNSSFRGVKINARNLTVDSGSSISSNNLGFYNGPGTMLENRAGGSYGGKGEFATEDYIYGSAVYPKDIGSSGAIQNDYYKGGGAIWLEISDTITNNGIISSNGGGSASGGSVYVNTKNVSGDGVFSANGGGLTATSVYYYPGGGGRTMIQYENSSFTGLVEATAGSGHVGYPDLDKGEDGTAGMYDKNNRVLYVDQSWEFLKEDESFEIEKIIASNQAKIKFQEGVSVDIEELVLEDFSEAIFTGQEVFSATNLRMKDNSKVTTYPEKILNLNADNLYIDTNATITVQALGYFDGPGSPSVEYWRKAGASYGGKGGGVNSRPVYGNKNAPVDFGSGTEGNRGGGAVHIKVANNLVNNGIITADGYQTRVSGGSVYIEAQNFSGTGRIFARGARGYYLDSDSINIAGGGGRIAIYYNDYTYNGEINASAGDFCLSGCLPGGENGTIVLIDRDERMLSSGKNISSFSFGSLNPVVYGSINDYLSVITATVPADTDWTSLVPTIMISPRATTETDLEIPTDFSHPVVYKIIAEDGTERSYTVNVSKEGVLIDDIPPIITNYSIGGTTEDLVVDPGEQDVVIDIYSDEDVDWVSIEIEKIDNTSIRKLYLSGELCEDWSNHCTKTWRGELSGTGTTLEEGDYHVNVHIKDASLNETYYVLPSLIKVIKIEDSGYVEIVI